MNLRQTMHAALRDEWDGLERITRDIRVADLFTLANCLAGITAMLLAARGHLDHATLVVVFGILLDGADGVVARMGRTWGGGPLGPPLDSLADAVTFVAAPTVIIVVAAGGLGAPWWLLAAAILYAASGLLRLARFETIRDPRPNRYFSGLPTPAGALLLTVPALVQPAHLGWTAALAAAVGILMASRIRYPKLRGWLGASCAALILLLLASAAVDDWTPRTAAVLLAFMGAYLLAGPFYVLTRYGPVQVPP